MADVGEEAALDLVEFAEFLVGFFELLPVLVQLETQGEFTEAEAVEKVISRNTLHPKT